MKKRAAIFMLCATMCLGTVQQAVVVASETLDLLDSGDQFLLESDDALEYTVPEQSAPEEEELPWGQSALEEEEELPTEDALQEIIPEMQYDLFQEESSNEEIMVSVGENLKGTWSFQDGKFTYYDEDGNAVSIASLKESGADEGLGYFEINGDYYALDEDGTPLTGLQTLNDALYYFEPWGTIPGKMYLNGWQYLEDSIGIRWLYFQEASAGNDRGKAVTYNGNHLETITPISTTVQYLFDQDGYLLCNAHVTLEDGTWVGSKSSGTLYRNTLASFDGMRWYFDENGSQVSWYDSYMFCPGLETYYYFGSIPGAVEERYGYHKVTDYSGNYIGWFYYDDNGDPVRNAFYDSRYFVDLGKSVGGFRDTKTDGVYFFATSTDSELKGTYYRNTLIHSKGKYYYAQEDGHLLEEGFVTLNGKQYAFKNYTLQINTLQWISGIYGYIDTYGVFHTGWCIASNAKNQAMYVDPDGGGFYRNTSVMIDGLLYYFDENGYRINDLTDIYTGPYFVTVDRINGVMTVYDSTGTVPVKTNRVSVGLPGTPTPTGVYTLRSYARWVALMGPSWGQYGTHVVGAGQGGIFVHSIACTYANSYNVPASAYNALGNPASHGCIRVCVADAKWVYEHCNGALIRIFDGVYNPNEAFKGPLGRRALVPMTGNYDPTDPAV